MSDVKVVTKADGEVLKFGPTTIRILEDGSGTENRVSALTSTMAAHTDGPPPHIHFMHDEAFLVTSDVLRFKIGDVQLDTRVGDYVVVPVRAPHTFVNASEEPVSFVATFRPAFYIESFRESAKWAQQDS